jgi:hypothetical protein
MNKLSEMSIDPHAVPVAGEQLRDEFAGRLRRFIVFKGGVLADPAPETSGCKKGFAFDIPLPPANPVEVDVAVVRVTSDILCVAERAFVVPAIHNLNVELAGDEFHITGYYLFIKGITVV